MTLHRILLQLSPAEQRLVARLDAWRQQGLLNPQGMAPQVELRAHAPSLGIAFREVRAPVRSEAGPRDAVFGRGGAGPAR